MKTTALLLFLAASLAAQPGKLGVADTSASKHAKIRNFDLASVEWTDGFWADRFRTVAAKSVPAMWKYELRAKVRNSE